MCKNLIKCLAAIGKDKWMHFAISMLLTLMLYAIGSACGLGAVAIAPAFFISMLVGFIKEKYDSKHGGIFDHYDIVADFLGCFISVVIASLLLI